MTSDLSSALEVCLRDALYKSTFTLLYFTLGKGCSPPQPTSGPGERCELPHRSTKTNLVHFVAARRVLVATVCLISVSLDTAIVQSH